MTDENKVEKINAKLAEAGQALSEASNEAGQAISKATNDASEAISKAADETKTRVTDAASVLVNGKPEPTFGENFVNGANELGHQIADAANDLGHQISESYNEWAKEGEKPAAAPAAEEKK